MPRRKHRKNPSEYWANSLGDAAYMRLNPSKSHHKPTAKQLAARKKFAAMARARAGRHNPAEYLDARMNPSEYHDPRKRRPSSKSHVLAQRIRLGMLAQPHPTPEQIHQAKISGLAVRAGMGSHFRHLDERDNPSEYLDARMNPSEYFGMYGGTDWDSLARSNPTRRHKRGGMHRNRKPTAKQLAARAKFSAMVRARAGRQNPAEYLDARMNPSEYFDARMNPAPKRDPNTGLWVSAATCPAGKLPPRNPRTGGFMPYALCRSNPSRRHKKRRKTRR